MNLTRLNGLYEVSKFSLYLIIICVILISTDLLWRWDQSFYDAQQRSFQRHAPNDVIIIAIDEASLSRLGRWPWRRNIHAELINRLSDEGARVIAMDIIFSEKDQNYPSDDYKLIQAVNNSGRVILPVFVEQARKGSVLHETLPLPELIEASSGLGHVHVELDTDGIARSVYLLEGLGKPHWPSFGVAVLQFIEPSRSLYLFDEKLESQKDVASPLKWIRDYHVKIPFYGPPGHFQTISYHQVLTGQYPKGLFKDQIIFVGVTATGLGDSLPTPVSGLSQSMPGVEINANIFSGVREGIMIKNISMGWYYALSIFIVILPAILFPLLRPRLAFIATILLIVFTIAISVAFFLFFKIWYGPISVVLTLMLSYPMWSWRRLEFTMKYLENELLGLKKQRGIGIVEHEWNLDSVFKFLASWLPVSGFTLINENAMTVYSWGQKIDKDVGKLRENQWIQLDLETYVYSSNDEAGQYFCAVSWQSKAKPSLRQLKLFNEIINKINTTKSDQPKTTYEILQKRIQEVAIATEQLSNLKRFIEDCLDQIADAVLVIDYGGKVVLANDRAKSLFKESFDEGPNNLDVLDILEKLHFASKWTWTDLLDEVFTNDSSIQLQGRLEDKVDLLINVSLMRLADELESYAFVISMSDITELIESERMRNEALSFLSHDLRSPLVSILALTELIGADKNSVIERKNLSRIEDHASRTIELAENFVQFSRAEGNEQIQFSEFNLVDVAINAMDQVWSQAQVKKINIHRDFTLNECYINGNAQLLERVFINLLTNSIKYSNENTKIAFIIDCSKSFIKCIIVDEGIGIPEDDLPHIMKRFKRVESHHHKKNKGMGLGLSFVNAVVERHGGEIEIESQQQKGTKVTIKLKKIN